MKQITVMRVKRRVACALVFIMTLAAAGNMAAAPAFAQTGADPTTPTAIVNAGFETTPTGAALNAAISNIIASSRVSGWNTTEPDGMIELWGDGFAPASGASNYNNFGGITFYSNKNVPGGWFAEINANFADSALYQDIYTVPGSLYEWSFDHRGRNGTDAAQMLLGVPNLAGFAQRPASAYYQGGVVNYGRPTATTGTLSPAGITPWNYASMMAPGTSTSTGTSSNFSLPDGGYAPDPANDPTILVAPRGVTGQPAAETQGNNWTKHKGFYTIPDGQDETRLEMHAVYSTYSNHAAGGGGTSVGNLVDNINFFPVAAPTQQTIYQGNPNPSDASMSMGYDVDQTNGIPNINQTTGMPQILSGNQTTPGFVYVPDFASGKNISAIGNAGEPYAANAGAVYTTASSGETINTTNIPAGLYDISVDVYSDDPYVAYESTFNSAANTWTLTNTPNPTVETIENPDGSGQLMAYVGQVTSQILVLPAYPVSGTLSNLPANNTGSDETYTVSYTYTNPTTGAMVNGSADVTVPAGAPAGTDAGYTIPSVPEGTTDLTITPPAVSGSSVDSQALRVGSVTEPITAAVTDQDFVYTPNPYTVSYTTGTGGSIGTPASETVLYGGSPASVPANTPDTGYSFAGWTLDHQVAASAAVAVGSTTYNAGDAIPAGTLLTAADLAKVIVTTNLTATAKWTANTAASYIVQHYKVDAGGTATLFATDSLTGATGTTATATAKTVTGYTYNASFAGTVAGGTIAGDGSLVLKLYYTVNTYNITYTITGTSPDGAPSAPASAAGVAYGTAQAAAPAPGPAPDGYTFSGWVTSDASVAGDGSFTMPDNAVSFTGEWVADDATPYTVEHYYVDASGNAAATPFATDSLTGTTDMTVAATPKTGLTGYTYNASCPGTAASGDIAGDGSLVLKLYYTANTHNVAYAYTGTVPAGAPDPAANNVADVAYSTTGTVAAAPTMSGYTFSGWSSSDAAVNSGAYTMPDNDVAFTGSWIAVPVLPPTTASWTVTFVNGLGDTLATQSVNDGGAATAPNDPVRAGYVFAGWDTSFGTVTGNMVVTAKWVPNWDSSSETPAPAQKTSAPENSSVSSITPITTLVLSGTNNPDATLIGPAPTPQAPAPVSAEPVSAGHAWSLLSCMLSIAAALTAVLLLVFVYFRKRKYEKYEDELDDQGLLTDDRQDELDDLQKKGRMLKALAILAGVLTPIIWLILDLPLRGMVWIDYSTPWTALVFGITMALTVAFNIRKKNPKDEDTEEDNLNPTYAK